jgi:hypothetical protein
MEKFAAKHGGGDATRLFFDRALKEARKHPDEKGVLTRLLRDIPKRYHISMFGLKLRDGRPDDAFISYDHGIQQMVSRFDRVTLEVNAAAGRLRELDGLLGRPVSTDEAYRETANALGESLRYFLIGSNDFHVMSKHQLEYFRKVFDAIETGAPRPSAAESFPPMVPPPPPPPKRL